MPENSGERKRSRRGARWVLGSGQGVGRAGEARGTGCPRLGSGHPESGMRGGQERRQDQPGGQAELPHRRLLASPQSAQHEGGAITCLREATPAAGRTDLGREMGMEPATEVDSPVRGNWVRNGPRSQDSR